jgi:lysophospholipase L1-like esterase
MSKPRAWIARAASVAVSTALAFLAAEAALRVARPAAVALDRQPAIFEPDPELGYRYVPGSRGVLRRGEFEVPIAINSEGFFDDEFARERRRIAVLGDSFVAGFQVGRGRNFPDRLEAALNQRVGEAAWEVMNFGMVGTGTLHQARLFDEVIRRHDPELVVLALFENDLDDVRQGIVFRESYRGFALTYLDPDQRTELAARVDEFLEANPGWIARLVEASFVARAVYRAIGPQAEPGLASNRVRGRGMGSLTGSRGEAAERMVAAIERMARECAAAGRALVPVVIPSKEEVRGERSSALAPVVDALVESGTRPLQLLDAFRSAAADGRQLFWRHDGHCNADGYGVIAAQLLARLDADGLTRGGGE